MAEPSWGASGGLRLSDSDRQQALDVLAEHFAQGRLTRDELDERSDAVWSAKTQGDLSPLFADLPVRAPSTPPRPRASGRPGWYAVRGALVPVLVVLVVLTVLTHLPFVLLAVALGLVVGHRRWHHHPGRGHGQAAS
jgi:uncharacterized membrane protein